MQQVAVFIHLEEHWDVGLPTGPVIYIYSSQEVAELAILKLLEPINVATLDEFLEWQTELEMMEYFHIYPCEDKRNGISKGVL